MSADTPTKVRNHWIIDRDHKADASAPAPSNTNAAGMRGPRNAPASTDDLTLRFRLLDDDGEVYCEGRMVPFERHADGSDGFEPLDNFGEPNAGCTSLEYWANGKWETL